MSTTKRFWPLLLIVAGIFLILGGNFYYTMTEEGLPDQDPTHEHISDLISFSGFVVFVVGVVAGIIRFIVRRFRPSATL